MKRNHEKCAKEDGRACGFCNAVYIAKRLRDINLKGA